MKKQTEEERKKLVFAFAKTWINSGVFVADVGACKTPFNEVFKNAIELVDGLEGAGCFEEKFGNDGSFEVGFALRSFAPAYRQKSGSVSGESFRFDCKVESVFDRVRELLKNGVLSNEEIACCRVVEIDNEKAAEIERKKAEEREEKERRKIDIENRRGEILAKIGK